MLVKPPLRATPFFSKDPFGPESEESLVQDQIRPAARMTATAVEMNSFFFIKTRFRLNTKLIFRLVGLAVRHKDSQVLNMNQNSVIKGDIPIVRECGIII
jgi:hypothetical protein